MTWCQVERKYGQESGNRDLLDCAGHAPGPYAMAKRLTPLLLVLLLLAPPPAAADGDARAFVEGLVGQAVATLTDGGLDDSGRRRAMRRLLVDSLDLDALHRAVLGRHWRRASPAQRSEFRALLEDLVVRLTAVDLSRYGAGAVLVRVERARDESGGGALVDTVVERPDGPPVAVRWRLRPDGEGYRVAGVAVEGLDLVVMLRSAIDRAVGDSGGDIEGLLAALRERARDMDRGGGAPGRRKGGRGE